MIPDAFLVSPFIDSFAEPNNQHLFKIIHFFTFLELPCRGYKVKTFVNTIIYLTFTQDDNRSEKTKDFNK